VREKYEEHYFDCAECATVLNALAYFVTASREILEERRVFPRLLRERAEQYRIATVGNEHEHKYAGDGKNEGLAAEKSRMMFR
jgi:hypothetical protein